MSVDHPRQESVSDPARKQKRWWGAILIVLGGLMITIGLGYALLNVAGDLLPIFLGVILAYAGVRILNRGKRHFVPVGLAALRKDPRPPVLYLRPFLEDGALNQISQNAINRGFSERGTWRHAGLIFRFLDTYEQHIAFAFRKIGPFVAIGDPTEGLPQLGAIRVYVGEDGNWQQMVSRLASQASYVLLQIGRSDGLMWEVQFVINNVQPEQLILCLPNQKWKLSRLSGPKKREQKRQELYQDFREKTRDYFPKSLPEGIGSAMFIYFDRNWTPIPSYYQSERIFSFDRSKKKQRDPKLEALNWLNSIIH